VLQLCKLKCMPQQNEAYKPVFKSVSSPQWKFVPEWLSVHYRWVRSCTLACLTKVITNCTIHIVTVQELCTQVQMTCLSPATSLVRTVDLFICGQDTDHAPVDLFICGQDTDHAPVTIYTQKVLPAAEHARHQQHYSPVLFLSKPWH